MQNTVTELQSQFCPYGYSDMKAICEMWDQVHLRENELYDIIDQARTDCWYNKWEDLDPVYFVLDHIVQNARRKIEQVTGFDFLNDSKFPIEVYGNYMCSSIEYSHEAVQELVSKTAREIDQLLDDEYCQFLLDQLEITPNN